MQPARSIRRVVDVREDGGQAQVYWAIGVVSMVLDMALEPRWKMGICTCATTLLKTLADRNRWIPTITCCICSRALPR